MVNKHVACSSETCVGFLRTTRCYISEHRILHNHLCENFKSYEDTFLSVCSIIYSFRNLLELLCRLGIDNATSHNLEQELEGSVIII
jgi:hypothetical protein